MTERDDNNQTHIPNLENNNEAKTTKTGLSRKAVATIVAGTVTATALVTLGGVRLFGGETDTSPATPRPTTSAPANPGDKETAPAPVAEEGEAIVPDASMRAIEVLPLNGDIDREKIAEAINSPVKPAELMPLLNEDKREELENQWDLAKDFFLKSHTRNYIAYDATGDKSGTHSTVHTEHLVMPSGFYSGKELSELPFNTEASEIEEIIGQPTYLNKREVREAVNSGDATELVAKINAVTNENALKSFKLYATELANSEEGKVDVLVRDALTRFSLSSTDFTYRSTAEELLNYGFNQIDDTFAASGWDRGSLEEYLSTDANQAMNDLESSISKATITRIQEAPLLDVTNPKHEAVGVTVISAYLEEKNPPVGNNGSLVEYIILPSPDGDPNKFQAVLTNRATLLAD